MDMKKMMDVRGVCSIACLMAMGVGAAAQRLDLDRGKASVVVEAYAPNIVRVTMSLDKARAMMGSGYGITAKPDAAGWTAETNEHGDVLRSSRMVVSVQGQGKRYTGKLPDTAKFFSGSTPYVGLSIKTPEGETLLDMRGWEMSVPNYKDGNHTILNERRPGDDPYFQVGATFAAPKDEHYYGLGQNQLGFFDRRGHVLRCAHDDE
jgi:alpha-D-xyloside xylohydrolase